jgi:hypothetical protein
MVAFFMDLFILSVQQGSMNADRFMRHRETIITLLAVFFPTVAADRKPE